MDNNELQKMFEQDSVSINAPTTGEMKDLQELVDAQTMLEEQIKKVEEYLAEVKEKLLGIQTVAIPNLMDEIGIKEFKLNNGKKVTVREDVRASIRKDFVSDAVRWLDEHGLGGIVKDEVKANFARGELERVRELLAFCAENNIAADEKLSVHPQTLKATVKEQMAKGVEFPEAFFSIFPDRKSIIK